MEIIRKKLEEANVSNPSFRYNPTTDGIEMTPDGGTTWIPSPEFDPRHSDAFRLPPLEEGDPQCDAAARMVAEFQSALEQLIVSVDAAVFATHILGLLVELSFFASILAGLALLLFDEFISIGLENIEEAFTPEVWEGIQNIIYCHIGIDGQMSVGQRDAAMADIASTYPGIVYDTLVNCVNLFGEVLLSNAGVIREETGDCSGAECEFCVHQDLVTSDGGWIGSSTGSSWIADWVSGLGWRPRSGSYFEAGSMHISFDPTNLTGVNIHYHGTGCDNVAYDNFTMRLYRSGVEVGSASSSNTQNDTTIVWTGDVEVDKIELYFNVSANCTSSFRIQWAQLAGRGDVPVSGDEC